MEYFRRYLSRLDPWPPDLEAMFENSNADIYGLMSGRSEFTPTGSLSTYEREADLSRLELPILYTAGRHDAATPESVKHYHDLTPNSRYFALSRSARPTPDALAFGDVKSLAWPLGSYSVAADNLPHAERKGLVFECAQSDAYVYTHPALLERIIGNFVGNAIRYTQRGKVAIHCETAGDYLCISVSDTGIGIPENALAKIFETFYQSDNPGSGSPQRPRPWIVDRQTRRDRPSFAGDIDHRRHW